MELCQRQPSRGWLKQAKRHGACRSRLAERLLLRSDFPHPVTQKEYHHECDRRSPSRTKQSAGHKELLIQRTVAMITEEQSIIATGLLSACES